MRVFCSNSSWSTNSAPYLLSSTLPISPLFIPITLQLGTAYGNEFNTLAFPPGFLDICSGGTPIGQEWRFRFDVNDGGYYNITQLVPSGMTIPNIGLKELNSVATQSSYTCVNYISTSTQFNTVWVEYQIGPLSEGVSYDIIFDAFDDTYVIVPFVVSCPAPENIVKSNITPTSIDIGWNCNCADSLTLEYGLPGFIPGVNNIPGINGTINLGSGTSQTISGLTPDTEYDLYVRSVCGGKYTGNVKYKMRTAKDCNLLPQLNCGDIASYVYAGASAKRGAWDLGGLDSADENVFIFTPTQSGNYSLYIYDLVANNSSYLYNMQAYFKPVSAGCNEIGWTLIGNQLQTPPGFVTDTLSFGPVTAGVSYYLALDSYSFPFIHGYSYKFQLQCSGVCYAPVLSNSTSTTPTSATVDVGCSTCFTNGMLEYGPVGFTPGTGTSAGVGGTLVNPVSFPYTINGLTPSVTYDIYVRSDCSSSSLGISVNNGPQTVTTCSVAPISITSNYVPGNFTCYGDTIKLYQNGGVLAPGSNFVWYKDSCGGTLVGIGDSIAVTPVLFTTYFVRAEGPCGNSSCVSKYINTFYPQISILGNDSICNGQSTTLSRSANWPTTLWSTGATTSTITVNTPGIYYLTVTAPSGCTDSASFTVYSLPDLVPVISGDSVNCAGSTAILDAGSGYSTYLWSDGSVSQTLAITTPGTYSVTVTNANGCSGSDSIAVIFNTPSPLSITASGSTTFCQGDSVILGATPGFSSYQWYRWFTPISGANASVFTAKSKGLYKCIAENAVVCSSTSNTIGVSVPCISTGPNQQKSDLNDTGEIQTLQVYPNPGIGLFTIDGPKGHVLVFNSLGSLILSVEKDIEKMELDISEFSEGIYLVIVNSDSKTLTCKMILDR